MADESHRVHLDGVDWTEVFPFLRLFGSFRMAIQPAKLLLALLLVILLYLGGQAMDFIWGGQVVPGEVAHYVHSPKQAFDRWLNTSRAVAAFPGSSMPPAGIFATTLDLEVGAFDQLVTSATAFDFGVRALLTGPTPESSASSAYAGLSGVSGGAGVGGGVLGALRTMVVIVPGWLYSAHPSFLAVYLFFAFLLLAIIGGAISRLAAVQACTAKPSGVGDALHFAGRRYGWFILAPLIPLLVAFIIGLVLAAAGALLFNFPIGDVIGAALFGLMLLGGLVITLFLLGLAVGVNLLYPALAVEGTDAFDVISRVFNYVLGRPWRYLFYTGVMLVYGAVTYLFVGLVIFMVLSITRGFVGWWNVNDIAPGAGRFDAILPAPQFGRLMQPTNWSALQASRSAMIAAWIVLVWVKLLIAVLPAYAVSYYFSAHTWIYLLLRRAADGTEYEQLSEDPRVVAQVVEAAPDKVEPVEPMVENKAVVATKDEG